MPRENQKRGRREQKKRKLEAYEDGHKEQDYAQKRPNTDNDGENLASKPSHEPLPDIEKPFFGLLDEQEQEYFKRADDLLEYNQFEGPEELLLFLANVYKEAEGKELRLASSQSCSRLLERLILLSNPEQLKNLFQKFSGNFLHLVQHRFASHCCESLFLHAAPIVSQELAAGGPPTSDDPNAIIESMENLFLYTINELESHVGYLMTDRFASHTLRILLIVFSGQPLGSSSHNEALRSRKKERITIVGTSKKSDASTDSRAVPNSFRTALEKLISDCVSGLDTAQLRSLATHNIGNPVLQVLLKTELQWYGKQRAKDENSILRKLIPDDPITSNSESAVFINNLIYDKVGSRLLEVMIECSPGKLFKNLYKQYFKERLPAHARNEIAGYVVCKVLERLSKEDLSEAVDHILPQIPGLLERNRTVVLKCLVDSCASRGAETSALAKIIQAEDHEGFDVPRLLKFDSSSSAAPADMAKIDVPADPAKEKLHYSLLAQSMLQVEGPLSDMVFIGLTKSEQADVLKLAYDPAGSRLIQAAIASPHATVILRRRMIQMFYGNVGEMSLDTYASHVIDAIWHGTSGLAFIRERIAEELAENESTLRDSVVGRHVWRKWDMDLWKRRRSEWVRKSREATGTDGFPGWPEGGFSSSATKEQTNASEARSSRSTAEAAPKNKRHTNGDENSKSDSMIASTQKQKTPLELARERHAANKAKRSKLKGSKTKAANQVDAESHRNGSDGKVEKED